MESLCVAMNTMAICPTYFLPLHKNFAICFPIDVLCCSIPHFPYSFVLCLCCYLHVILMKVVWNFLRTFWTFLRVAWTFLSNIFTFLMKYLYLQLVQRLINCILFPFVSTTLGSRAPKCAPLVSPPFGFFLTHIQLLYTSI